MHIAYRPCLPCCTGLCRSAPRVCTVSDVFQTFIAYHLTNNLILFPPPCRILDGAMCAIASAANFVAQGETGWSCSGGFPSTSVCSPWQGVTCSAGEIVGIAQRNYMLVGTLPSSIGVISSLTSLDFSWNSLHGHLPSTLGALTKIVSMDLGFTLFSGTIPSALGQISSLTSLMLSGSRLNGTLPSSIVALSGLQQLAIDGTSLTGSLPTTLCSATALTSLSIASSALSCFPSCLSSMTYLSRGNVSVCMQGQRIQLIDAH